MISLSVDKVPNVRLAVARTIATDVIGMGCKYTCVYSCRNIYIILDRYVTYNLFRIFVFLVDTLGMEAMEEVERTLAKLRLDGDRDVRIFAGGEEQLDVLAVLAYYSSDENNQVEQAKNILF